ncbi:MAG: radical SAM protein [Elusimicrobiota bacterium]|jgi:MoaA/NifB/PqqE/SkfB family radical SAM enzyme
MNEELNMASRLPRRDTVFAWDLHYHCNYRCEYCFFTRAGWHELARKNVYRSVEEWAAIWGRVHARYGRCQLRVTSGEPFTYPRFAELVAAVGAFHDLQITTNCSQGAALESFLLSADPRTVELDCTFHPASASLEEFTARVRALRAKGFTANVCCLAYPPNLPRLAEFKRAFAREGLYMNLGVFWGGFEGREYPFAYTEEDRRLLREVAGQDMGPEMVNLDPVAVLGRLCGAGRRYAVVQADGRVYRCGQLGQEGRDIGRIDDEEFRLLGEDSPCGAQYCRCKEFQSAWEDCPVPAGAGTERGAV